MTKKIIFTILQFILFLAAAFAAAFVGPFVKIVLHLPFHLRWWYTNTGNAESYFVPDALLLATGILLVIVLIQAVRRKLCNTPWTILAFVAAFLVACYWKTDFGFVSHKINNGSFLQGLARIHEYFG